MLPKILKVSARCKTLTCCPCCKVIGNSDLLDILKVDINVFFECLTIVNNKLIADQIREFF